MENITNYTLEEFIRLYEDLEKLINLPEKEYYSRGQFKKRKEFIELLNDYAINLIKLNTKNLKIAAVIINSRYLGKSGEFYKYLDNELRNNKLITLLAIKNGLNQENYNLIGNNLRNDKEIMFLVAIFDYSKTKEISLKCFNEELLKDKDFFTYIFSNVSAIEYNLKVVLETCQKNRIDIDIKLLTSAWNESKKIKQIYSLTMYENPYDSGTIDYTKTYDNIEMIELIESLKQSNSEENTNKQR